MNDQLAHGVMENDGKESYFNHIQGGANLIYKVQRKVHKWHMYLLDNMKKEYDRRATT